jgi:hypothetical protein
MPVTAFMPASGEKFAQPQRPTAIVNIRVRKPRWGMTRSYSAAGLGATRSFCPFQDVGSAGRLLT